MKNKQGGFTLIELVMVIVIMGILAAVALPRFIDLSGKAQDSAAAAIAGNLASASEINYGAYKTGVAGYVVLNSALTTTNLGLLLKNGWPTGYTITGTPTCTAPMSFATVTIANGSSSANAVVNCTN